jgi:CRP-like cAMP-binding protein
MTKERFPAFRRVLDSLVELEDLDWQRMERVLVAERIAKGRSFIRAGEVCSRVGFVVSGLLRTFTTTGAAERTCDFVGEGGWVSDYASVLSGRPSEYTIEAYEGSSLVTLSRAAMLRLYDEIPQGDRLGRLIAEQLFVRAVDYGAEQRTKTPEERYRAFRERSPELLQRIKLYDVASFIGVTPETLSRIRRRSARRDVQRTRIVSSIDVPSKSNAPSSKDGGPNIPRASREKP